MKSILTFLAIAGFSFLTTAQDTITIQTFTWDSTSRAASFQFPDNPGETYRKILMKYNMRCHDAAVGNGQVGCGEWDYHCNTVITDPSAMDSIKASHPTHIISNFSGDEFKYSLEQTFSYIEYNQRLVEYLSTNNETETILNDGELSLDLSSFNGVLKTQTVLPYSKLEVAGLNSDAIMGIKIYADEASSLPFLRIKLSNIDYNESQEFTPDLTIVQDQYFSNTQVTTGENHLKFHTPFQWDGNSSILVEMSYTSDEAVSLNLQADLSDNSNTYVNNNTDYFVNFSGGDFFDIEAAIFENIDSLLTISMWTRGDISLPVNTYLFEGIDDGDLRQANVHLPWSNADIYWDCGNDGSGYDRINKGSFTTEFRDVWTHWTFIKDVKSSSMTILKNGTQWHTSSGKPKAIDITKFVLGASANYTSGYLGDIDDVRIWNQAVDLSTIKEYMFKDLDDQHPYRDFLIADFNLNEGNGQNINGTQTSSKGTTTKNPNWRRVRGRDLRTNFSMSDLNPRITLVQGDYNTQYYENTIIDSFPNPSNTVTEYQAIDNNIEEVSALEYYSAEPSLIYDEDGNIIGEVENNIDGTLSISSLDYYRFWEARYEILSFITPYGNGLDLGADGVTYTIDMSDYANILKGTKTMSVEGVGNTQEELDIKFHFIKGTPHAEIKEIKQLWPVRNANQVWSGFSIANIDNDLVLEPRNVFIPQDIGYVKLRSAVTGHGQNGEFQSRQHYVNINGGFEEALYSVWKECGDNPVYPQGGTWIFDRAGWCPGMETDVHEFEIGPFLNKGEYNEFDYGVKGGVVGNMEYRVNNQLILFEEPNFNIDVELIDILNPSNKTEYARFNPSCNLPNIIVRNSGIEKLSSFDITYGMEGGETLTDTWTGNLRYLDSKTIELVVPDHHFWESGNGNFYVELSNPNGQVDESPENSKMTTKYVAPFTSAKDLKIDINTDNKPQDSRINIFDSKGDLALELFGFGSNSTYSLDLDLPGGCYTMELIDLSDDGLEFWFFPNNGTGWIRMTENNIPVNTFDSDFGGNLYLDFIINGTSKTNELEMAQSLGVSPNPVNDLLNIHWTTENMLDGKAQVIDQTGKIIITKQIQSIGNSTLDVSNLHAGIYHLNIISKTGVISKKFIKM